MNPRCTEILTHGNGSTKVKIPRTVGWICATETILYLADVTLQGCSCKGKKTTVKYHRSPGLSDEHRPSPISPSSREHKTTGPSPCFLPWAALTLPLTHTHSPTHTHARTHPRARAHTAPQVQWLKRFAICLPGPFPLTFPTPPSPAPGPASPPLGAACCLVCIRAGLAPRSLGTSRSPFCGCSSSLTQPWMVL